MTNAELERLAILSEECGEVVHIISKIIRHGFRSFHPSNPEKSNRRLLEKELADLLFIIDFMVDCGDISHNGILTQLDKKAEDIGKYLHHNKLPS